MSDNRTAHVLRTFPSTNPYEAGVVYAVVACPTCRGEHVLDIRSVPSLLTGAVAFAHAGSEGWARVYASARPGLAQFDSIIWEA